MKSYGNKRELIEEIQKQATLFIEEFSDIEDEQKDTLVEGVDRSPAQMIAYQLGWMNLLLSWEERELRGELVKTPHETYKWNNLGGLYAGFYEQYHHLTMQQLKDEFHAAVARVEVMVESLSDSDLFEPGSRQWASSTPANWPVWKWVHINTAAPFKTFRAKIRKWKK